MVRPVLEKKKEKRYELKTRWPFSVQTEAKFFLGCVHYKKLCNCLSFPVSSFSFTAFLDGLTKIFCVCSVSCRCRQLCQTYFLDIAANVYIRFKVQTKENWVDKQKSLREKKKKGVQKKKSIDAQCKSNVMIIADKRTMRLFSNKQNCSFF